MDKRVTKLLKISRSKNQRSIIVVLGNEAIYKVPELYNLVAREKCKTPVWFSSDLGDLNKIGWFCKQNGSNDQNDSNDLKTQVIHISGCDTQNALLQSCHFAVVQDKLNIKPSDLLKVVDSIPGKGVLVFIFSKITDINKFTSPKRCDYVTSGFMKRLFASFTSCSSCIILDDKLNVLSLSKRRPNESKALLKDSSSQVQDKLETKILQNHDDNVAALDSLTGICSTEDQSRFLMQALDVLKKRILHSMISASSTGGRGTSVVLGLAIAGAIVLKYSNIFISSLNYVNVKIIFKYLLLGLDALQYKEDEDYDLIQSANPKVNNALLGLNIFKDHPQAVRFILPGDVENKLEQAELVIIDDAAAIPLTLLKKLLGPYIVLMASTTESCGGSGKYSYKNMISEIQQSSALKSQDKTVSLKSLFPTSETSSWKEVVLTEPTNYSAGDPVEHWINQTLCLECCLNIKLSHGCPDPGICELFFVSQETLFSYEDYAEKFLQQLMSLFLSTKSKISPDLLLKIADDSDYHIFCLLPPFDSKIGSYEILCAILVHTEKHIPRNIVYSAINQLEDLPGCFNDWASSFEQGKEQDFLAVQGVHIVDIVTHPNYRKMGYGSRAVHLLQDFYEGKCVSLNDAPYAYSCKSKKSIVNINSSLPLLLQLTEVEPENVDYLLVSYYLTSNILRFWKKSEFVPVYISGQKNLAQEHLCMMMKGAGNNILAFMKESWRVFCEYYFLLLSSDLKYFSSELVLNLLTCKFNKQLTKEALTKEDIDIYLKPQRMKALEKYCQNLGDLHCIMPCIPILSKLFFRQRFIGIEMPVAQQVILLAFGMQHKTIDDIASDLSLHSTQVHGLLNRTIRKLSSYLTSIIEKTVEKTIAVRDINMVPVAQALEDELEEAAQKIKQKQIEDLKKLKAMDFSEFAIKGSEEDWEKALHCGRKTLVSIKSLKKAPEDADLSPQEKNKPFKNKKKDMKRKR